MSLHKSALIAGGLVVALAAAAFAQNVESWDLKERNAYVIDAQGKLRSFPMSEQQVKLLGTHSVKVPNGTVFFLHNGEFHHADGAGVVFDKAGNPLSGGN